MEKMPSAETARRIKISILDNFGQAEKELDATMVGDIQLDASGAPFATVAFDSFGPGGSHMARWDSQKKIWTTDNLG